MTRGLPVPLGPPAWIGPSLARDARLRLHTPRASARPLAPTPSAAAPSGRGRRCLARPVATSAALLATELRRCLARSVAAPPCSSGNLS